MSYSRTKRRVRAARIGYVLKRFPRLSETFILNEMLELERQGVEVEVFSLKRPTDEPRHALLSRLRAPVTYVSERLARSVVTLGTAMRADDLDMVRLHFPGKTAKQQSDLVWKSAAIGTLARRAGITHLHAHFMSAPTTAAMLASRSSEIPYSFTAHARDIFHVYHSRDIDDAARVSKIAEARFAVTVSEFNRAHLRRLAGPEHAAKINRLYNGIDLQRFSPTVAYTPRYRILAIGRLIEKKGIEHLIDACALLAARGSDFTCDIIGQGPLYGQLQARIAGQGLEERVRLLGARSPDDVVAALHQSSVLAAPCVVAGSGDRDGLPTVLLEAMAAGVPCISTRVAGIPEIIEHGVTGLLVEPGDVGALAEALDDILTSAPLAGSFSVAGRERAARLFDLEANVATLAGLFQRTCTIADSMGRDDDAHRLSVG